MLLCLYMQVNSKRVLSLAQLVTAAMNPPKVVNRRYATPKHRIHWAFREGSYSSYHDIESKVGSPGPRHARSASIDRTQQLRLQNELPLFVLLTSLISLVVFPTHRLITLLALDVTHDMSAGGHIPFHRFSLLDVDDGGEEECLSVLAAKVPRDDVVEVR